MPLLAVSISKRCSLEKCRWANMASLSHHGLCLRSTTVMHSVSLRRTSILVFTPLFISAAISRPAATAAPPVFSLVFTISTLMVGSL